VSSGARPFPDLLDVGLRKLQTPGSPIILLFFKGREGFGCGIADLNFIALDCRTMVPDKWVGVRNGSGGRAPRLLRSKQCAVIDARSSVAVEGLPVYCSRLACATNWVESSHTQVKEQHAAERFSWAAFPFACVLEVRVDLKSSLGVVHSCRNL
jgi:hypothetical protein